MGMLEHLRRQRIVTMTEANKPPEVPWRYYSKRPYTQGWLWSQDYSKAGRILEAAFLMGCGVMKEYYPFEIDVNDPNGAIWDFKAHHGGGFWSPALSGRTVNIKGANVVKISRIGDLEYTIPFKARIKGWTRAKGQVEVANWIARNAYDRLILLKPETSDFGIHFVKQVHSENWRTVALLLSGRHWRKTELGGPFHTKFYAKPKPRSNLVQSISISKGSESFGFDSGDPSLDLDIDQDPYGFGYGQSTTLFGDYMSQRNIAPKYPGPVNPGPKYKINPKTLVKYMGRPIRPRYEDLLAEADARVFMRTVETSEHGHAWVLQSSELVNEPLSIISPEAYRVLSTRLPMEGM